MAILNLERTNNHIVNWIKQYASSAGTNTLILGLSGGVDSALVSLLCKQTRLKTICVNLPCHSSGYSWERAIKFSEEYGLSALTINLDSCFDSIENNLYHSRPLAYAKEFPRSESEYTAELAFGGLKSCLRASTLSFFAQICKGLIVGTGNRSEDNLIRYYQKRGDGAVDISPIGDLFKSEVYELFEFLSKKLCEPNNREQDQMPKAAYDIYMAKPTADLWPDQTDESELGLTYDEIEWADRENMRVGIISNEADPAKQMSWMGYSGRQRQVIAKVHQMEKISRHKHNPNLPVCKVRNVEGLVR